MTAINPNRMIGRIQYSFNKLLNKYKLMAANGNNDTAMMLIALAQRLPDPDSSFCLKMATELIKLRESAKELNESFDEEMYQEGLGEAEAEYIFLNYKNYYEMITADENYLEKMKKDRVKSFFKRHKKAVVVISIILAFILFKIIYNLPYFEEKRLYDHVEEMFSSGDYEITNIAIEKYIDQFPAGKHIDEVLNIQLDAAINTVEPEAVLNAVDKYLELMPKGKYVTKAKAARDSVWDNEIRKYKTKASGIASAEGSKYILDLLTYLKSKNSRTIYVEGNPKLNLTDFDEYPEIVRQGVTMSLGTNASSEVLSIKDKITDEKVKSWIDQVTNGLQKGFDNVLSPGFIRFENVTDSIAPPAGSPKIIFNFTVGTQTHKENGYTIPDVWYEEGNFLNKLNLLGINLDFDVSFFLDNDTPVINIKESGDPGNSTIQIQSFSKSPYVYSELDVNKVYDIMCQRSVVALSDKIEKQFGLETKDDGSSQ